MDDPDQQQSPTTRGRFDLRRWGVFLAAQFRQGVRRMQGSLVPILQAALAASLAWLIAEQLLGRTNPMFAPIAAFVCLGFKIDRVPRKVAELGVGATVGVLIGEVFASTVQVGWWQVGLALVVGSLAGRFLDRGDLTTIQGGVNAVVVLGMSWWQAVTGGVTGRWIDAIVGAGVAFVFAALLPRHPTSRPRRYARNTLSELATLIDMVGRGLSAGDTEQLSDSRGQRRAVGELAADWEETLTTAREVVRVNPSLWGQRAEVAELSRLFRLTTRAQRPTYMLARQGLSMVEEVGPLPEIGTLLVRIARAAHALAGSVGQWNRPALARSILLEVAAEAAPSGLGGEDWRPVALMSLVRALVVDMLQLTGLSREQARDALTDTWGRPYGEHDVDLPSSQSDDGASPLWG